jgi:hypothetical protein
MPSLRKQLRTIAAEVALSRVYTHSPWGDYGHRHHVDVALAAHEVFGTRVRCLAGPLPAIERAVLTEAEFAQKTAHTKLVYRSQAFAHEWCTRVEAFAYLDLPTTRFLAELSQPRLRRALAPPGVQIPRGMASVSQQFVSGFTPGAPLPPELEGIPYPVWSAKIIRLRRRLARAAGLQAAPLIRLSNGVCYQRGDFKHGYEIEAAEGPRLA